MLANDEIRDTRDERRTTDEVDGHFEHLLGRFSLAQDMLAIEVSRGLQSLSAAYQDEEPVSDHDSVATQDVN